MDDLLVPPGPGAPGGIRVPAAELVEQFSRSSGPGGQGVNTTDSRVQLSFDVASSASFTDAQRARILAKLGRPVVTIAASEERSQRQNRQAARARLAELLRDAVMPEVQRRATKPTRGSQRRRLEGKRQRAELKQSRRRPAGD
ncbi:aminoacyl-tRNA hydrolase [Microbacterium sorbitolivorans]|uniref:Aminoacyl-tRNA hydrolase n=1 Tax=Microbacterium sorbitolivorans TaxID=1867410 RepID=A0A367Y625_9MICO|nr:alternative ribosome rescue aminoacyl-tRNA hydrolase ArfB [Microbacterium sorbitolivorans]RCK61316.1 aminoacyl-tRNA hydrolase [Microbacterium sorbitolivorans]GGF33233.1 aminoacyl-tRNA hydrolase [Microbacterium sorbitolivorans]